MSWPQPIRMVMNIRTPTSVSGSSTTLQDQSISMFHGLPFAILSDSRNFRLNLSCYRPPSLFSALLALLLKYSRTTQSSSQDG